MTIRVTVARSLAARLGVRRTYLALPEGAVLADVIDRLADRYGTGLRDALCEDDGLHGEIAAVREANVSTVDLSMDSPVRTGDRIRFREADSPGEAVQGVHDAQGGSSVTAGEL